MSESSHDDMQHIVLSLLTEQVGLDTKKVRHFLRSAAAKRKIMEHGDKVAQDELRDGQEKLRVGQDEVRGGQSRHEELIEGPLKKGGDHQV